jgi:hypothetical protein
MTNSTKKPVYAKKACSGDFILNFSGGGTNGAITCICGRTHFSGEFQPEDEADEREKIKLEELMEQDPDSYIFHNDSISHFSSIDGEIIFDCPCHYSGFLERIILQHSWNILTYLDSTSAKRKESADRFRDKVLKTKNSNSD